MHPDRYDHVAEFYDEFSLYRDRPDVSFFVEEGVQCGGRVLELGCGTGRVLIPTSRAGVEIVGLDLAESMLSRCREKLAQEPEGVRSRATLVSGDMRDFSLDGTFRLATLPFRPFQHLLTVEDQLRCLGCISRHLENGGWMILDVFNPSLTALTDESRFEEHATGEPFNMPDGRKVERRERIVSRDLAAQTIEVELIYYVTHPDGRRERLVDSFRMRYFFRFEAEHLLVRAGFEVETVYGDYDRSPFGGKDPSELIVSARKP